MLNPIKHLIKDRSTHRRAGLFLEGRKNHTLGIANNGNWMETKSLNEEESLKERQQFGKKWVLDTWERTSRTKIKSSQIIRHKDTTSNNTRITGKRTIKKDVIIMMRRLGLRLGNKSKIMPFRPPIRNLKICEHVRAIFHSIPRFSYEYCPKY